MLSFAAGHPGRRSMSPHSPVRRQASERGGRAAFGAPDSFRGGASFRDESGSGAQRKSFRASSSLRGSLRVGGGISSFVARDSDLPRAADKEEEKEFLEEMAMEQRAQTRMVIWANLFVYVSWVRAGGGAGWPGDERAGARGGCRRLAVPPAEASAARCASSPHAAGPPPSPRLASAPSSGDSQLVRLRLRARHTLTRHSRTHVLHLPGAFS